MSFGQVSVKRMVSGFLFVTIVIVGLNDPPATFAQLGDRFGITDPFGLRRDQRLAATVHISATNPSLDEMLRKVEQATKLSMTIDPKLTNHRPYFGRVQMRKGKAWSVLELIARHQLLDGRWIKTKLGYELTAKAILPGKPPSNRKTPQAKPSAPGRAGNAHPLAFDPRLRAKLTIKAKNPKLSEVLHRLQTATGLTFTVDDSLISHDPELGHMQMVNAPAFAFMEHLSNRQLKDGRWEKTDSGYRLYGTSTAPSAIAATTVWPFGQLLTAIVISIAGIAFLALCVYAITRKPASKTPPAPSKTR